MRNSPVWSYRCAAIGFVTTACGLALLASPRKVNSSGVSTRYTITSIQGARFRAAALNNNGEVVGEIDVTPGLKKPGDRVSGPPDIRGFLWRKGRFQPLGRFPGSTWLRPTAMNDGGDVVGYAMVRGGWHCFFWRKGRIVDLGTLNATDYRDDEEASGVNNHGVVVGRVNGPEYQPLGFTWTEKQGLKALPLDGAKFSMAFDVNDHGEVAGQAVIPGHFMEAVVWRKGKLVRLGLLSGAVSHATAINNRGEVVGRAAIKSTITDPKLSAIQDDHAFLWRKGRMVDLGTLPGFPESDASDINDAGDIVGTADQGSIGLATGKAGYRSCPFLWRNGHMVNLNDLLPKGSGWVLTGASAINNRGQILGVGAYHGKPRGFLMTPVR